MQMCTLKHIIASSEVIDNLIIIVSSVVKIHQNIKILNQSLQLM